MQEEDANREDNDNQAEKPEYPKDANTFAAQSGSAESPGTNL